MAKEVCRNPFVALKDLKITDLEGVGVAEFLDLSLKKRFTLASVKRLDIPKTSYTFIYHISI